MANLNLQGASALFKNKYGKLSDNVYNSATVLLARVKKEYNFTGKRMDVPIPTSFAGGVGSGSLPTPNAAAYEDAVITAKKMYAVIEVDRESIKTAENDEGAFVRLTKHAVQKGVESWMRNMSRTLFNDGSGSLGTIQANATGTAAAPIVVISAATWKEANWEEKDYVNPSSELTAVFEITNVDPATRSISLNRISGSVDLTAAGTGVILYMQGSKDNDPEGITGVLDATSGTKYSVPVSRRWSASSNINAQSAALSTDLMNQCMLEVERKCGKVPNLIITSYTQYRKLLNLLEDQKQYVVEARATELKGKVSFKGVEFMSSAGAVGVFADRFCQEDRMYFLNDNYITIHHRPGFGWFSDDGTVFLRGATTDTYSARYGGYLQTYVVPPFHGQIKGLGI